MRCWGTIRRRQTHIHREGGAVDGCHGRSDVEHGGEGVSAAAKHHSHHLGWGAPATASVVARRAHAGGATRAVCRPIGWACDAHAGVAHEALGAAIGAVAPDAISQGHARRAVGAGGSTRVDGPTPNATTCDGGGHSLIVAVEGVGAARQCGQACPVVIASWVPRCVHQSPFRASGARHDEAVDAGAHQLVVGPA